MELTIRSHHTRTSDGFEERARKKLARLDRVLPRAGSAVIEVEHEGTKAPGQRYVVHVTVKAGAITLRVSERGADPLAALELAADALTQQARREKERLDAAHHPHPRDGRPAKEIVADRVNAPPPGPAQD
jgi:ribosomal subunit interface protein